ncbi:META and DUF4377 domain-containing protein [Lysobacter niastensis]|uniref:META and DUF4377 domain-containing protein n=1 Tax=Lysobacter niastensis TaxID=380629 RepID=A0ABS0B3T1_9GAMM|nr:META and DUF4377 domain-containing protein [Lysobacter niastensis]MBF6023140.1 META and DUF4377 domain-containing protein [Lysobacter niastensis]
MKRLALLTLPLALAACAKPVHDTDTPPAPAAAAATADATLLGGYHWKLANAVDAQGRRIDALFVRAERPVQLDFSDGRISVTNTCNRMGGAYTLEGGRLAIPRMASTMMACADPKLMALDREVGMRLESPQALAVQRGDVPQLTLTSASGDALTFNGEATAQTRYGGAGETVFMEVAAQRKPCSHPLIRDMQCLQVRDVHYDERGLKTGTPGPWQPLYQEIEGYEHTDGVRNVLRLKRYDVRNPPADASSVAYVLDMVVESETVREGK